VTAVLLLLLAAAPAAALPTSLQETEARAAQALRQTFERAGRDAPQLDPALSAAARSLAAEAQRSSAPAAASPDAATVAEAVSAAGAWEPRPRVWIIRATPLEAGLAAFRRRTDLALEAATHAGLALVGDVDRGVLALILADRKAELHSFARRLRVPGVHELCGELRPPLERPEVYVTLPAGRVERVAPVRAAPGGFCAPLTLRSTGRYAVEVVGTGPSGPEVAALFSLEVGDRSPVAGGPPPPEPATAAAARAAILGRINALRAAEGITPVAADQRLDAVAQAYAERMAAEHFFAHIAPDGSSIDQRLRAAGFLYRAAGENLGLSGSGPMAAHLGVEESPGHRGNLLSPGFTLLGIGIAQEMLAGQTRTLVVEVLAAPERLSGDPLGDAYRRIAEQRAQLGLPELVRSSQLEVVAAEQARLALDGGDPPGDEMLAPERLYHRVSQSLTGVESTSADLFIAEDLSQLPRSRGVADAHKDLVGVGAIRGETSPGGRDRYWVVVIYAGRH
jgi:uncharacterized protein YkwD